ncbi:MAG: tetratricopeptide repeat protein [Planctomyces sp.]|nr:tetratricopeptide repeat protein [Planctomyces sp.]
MNHQNWDYAVECFGRCALLVPDNVMYRQTRHGCIRKKYNDNGSGAKLGGVKLMGVRGRIKKARLSKDWKNLEIAAEEGLLTNPWDAALFFDLGEACMALENFDVAKYALGRAVDLDKENAEYNEGFARLLEERGDHQGAAACWQRILKKDPGSTKARMMINRLQAESVMDRGGYGKAESTKDVKVETPAQANAYEQDRIARKGGAPKADAPGESVEADLQHAIRKDPKNVNHYLKLADHYRDQRELGKAQDLLNQALEVSNNNADIREQLEDVQIMMLKKDLAEARERAEKNPGKERIVEKAKTLAEELITREIDVFARRIERHTNDMRMRFELADRYRERKEWAKAIPLYQQSATDVRLKGDALVWLGECFVRDGKLDLGRRQFERALETINVNDKPDAFKLAHYWLGRIYEKAKRNEQAEQHYSEILALDYDYRDVLKRLNDLQGDSGESVE